MGLKCATDVCIADLFVDTLLGMLENRHESVSSALDTTCPLISLMECMPDMGIRPYQLCYICSGLLFPFPS